MPEYKYVLEIVLMSIKSVRGKRIVLKQLESVRDQITAKDHVGVKALVQKNIPEIVLTRTEIVKLQKNVSETALTSIEGTRIQNVSVIVLTPTETKERLQKRSTSYTDNIDAIENNMITAQESFRPH